VIGLERKAPARAERIPNYQMNRTRFLVAVPVHAGWRPAFPDLAVRHKLELQGRLTRDDENKRPEQWQVSFRLERARAARRREEYEPVPASAKI
jgi:hypothetical protein